PCSPVPAGRTTPTEPTLEQPQASQLSAWSSPLDLARVQGGHALTVVAEGMRGTWVHRKDSRFRNANLNNSLVDRPVRALERLVRRRLRRRAGPSPAAR